MASNLFKRQFFFQIFENSYIQYLLEAYHSGNAISKIGISIGCLFLLRLVYLVFHRLIVGKKKLQHYGKWALVTGASSGIGKALAIVLAEKGMNCVISARRQSLLDSLANEIMKKYPVKVKYVVQDLSVSDGANELVRKVDNILPPGHNIGLLFNNAGFGMWDEFDTYSRKKIEQMIQLNILSLTQLTHIYLNRFKKNNTGLIVFVSSLLGGVSFPMTSVYAASKHYVSSLGFALQVECSKYRNIDVLVVEPGGISSEFLDVAIPYNVPSFQSLILKVLMTPSSLATRVVSDIENRLLVSHSDLLVWFVRIVFRFIPTWYLYYPYSILGSILRTIASSLKKKVE